MNSHTPKSLLAATLLAGAASAVPAQELKIGYVNSDRVLREAVPAKAAQTKLEAEFSKAKHVGGTVCRARGQNPDSGDSQFFICFGDARFLDNHYTVWGKVSAGMENVDKIKRGEPVKDPDKIVSIKVAADA